MHVSQMARRGVCKQFHGKSDSRIKRGYRPNSCGRNYQAPKEKLPSCLSNLQKKIELVQLEIAKKQKEENEKKIDFSKIFFHQKNKDAELNAIKAARNYLAPDLEKFPKELSRLDRTCSLYSSIANKIHEHDLEQGADHAAEAFCKINKIDKEKIRKEASFLDQAAEKTALQIAKRIQLLFFKRGLPESTPSTIFDYYELTQLPKDVIKHAFKAYSYAHLHQRQSEQKSELNGELIDLKRDGYAVFVHVKTLAILDKKTSFEKGPHAITNAIQLLPDINLKLESITSKEKALLAYETYKQQQGKNLPSNESNDTEHESYCQEYLKSASLVSKEWMIQPACHYQTTNAGTILFKEKGSIQLSSDKENRVKENRPIRNLSDLAEIVKEGKATRQEIRKIHSFFLQGLRAVKALHDQNLVHLDLSLNAFVFKSETKCVIELSKLFKVKDSTESAPEATRKPKNSSKKEAIVAQDKPEQIDQTGYSTDVYSLGKALGDFLRAANANEITIDKDLQSLITDAISQDAKNRCSIEEFIKRFEPLKEQFTDSLLNLVKGSF